VEGGGNEPSGEIRKETKVNSNVAKKRWLKSSQRMWYDEARVRANPRSFGWALRGGSGVITEDERNREKPTRKRGRRDS